MNRDKFCVRRRRPQPAKKIEVLLGQGSLNCTVNACNMGGNDDGKNV